MKKYGIWLAGIALIVWTVMPLLWALLATSKDTSEVYANNFWPEQFSLQAWGDLFQLDGFWRFAFNSLYVTTVSTVIAVAISIVAAYAFARYAFKWRHILLLFILVPRLVPRVALIVPLYLMFSKVGLIDTYTVIIVLYVASAVPLATWTLIGFIGAIPREIEEASAIDGASLLRRLWTIVLPLTIPGLVTVTIVSFVESWNEFPFALAFLQDTEMRTLPYQLFSLESSLGLIDWPLISAFAIFTMLPILVLYLRFEKSIVSGMTAGAVK
ncbi:carbohydrate ABC transporter permease [Nesterenkonia sp. Act20]|uniref:carbohydrate ABC transporter permease n=1 Tax=Nesterenkonia sp. Act20 TaxID=1483432 RepID=UPI001C44A51F|nr:carbohydrate ABC transporter permease [Nesterenkonia sp. Act20]